MCIRGSQRHLGKGHRVRLKEGEVGLTYAVRGRAVRDTPSFIRLAGYPTFSRAVMVGAGPRALTMQVATGRGETSFHQGVDGERVASLVFSSAAGNEDGIGMAVVDAPAGVKLTAHVEGTVALIPASDAPLSFRIAVARLSDGGARVRWRKGFSRSFRESWISVACSSQESAAMEVLACCLNPYYRRRLDSSLVRRASTTRPSPSRSIPLARNANVPNVASCRRASIAVTFDSLPIYQCVGTGSA